MSWIRWPFCDRSISLSHAGGNEFESLYWVIWRGRFIPHAWERVVLHIHSNTMYYVYSTWVGMNRHTLAFFISSSCLSHAGGNESETEAYYYEAYAFIPRGWEWIGMVYYMKESCRLSYMRGNESNFWRFAARMEKFIQRALEWFEAHFTSTKSSGIYPTCMGMIRTIDNSICSNQGCLTCVGMNLALAISLARRWYLSHASGSESQ